MIVQALIGSGSSDPYKAYVVSLLHFTGASGSTTITDELGITWTAVGNTQLSNAAAKFGTTSCHFDGTDDRINGESADYSLFAMSGDYTIEGYVYSSISPSSSTIVARTSGGPGGKCWDLYVDSGNKLHFTAWDNTNIIVDLTGTTSLVASGWYYVALSKVGSDYYLFLNGTLEASGTQSGSPATAGTPVVIGRTTGGAVGDWTGYMDEMRFTDGIGRYTASFTPQNYPYSLA